VGVPEREVSQTPNINEHNRLTNHPGGTSAGRDENGQMDV